MTAATTVSSRPRVLFVGDDASSPQIAASLLRHLTDNGVAVRTAGTELVDHGGRSDEMLVGMGLNPTDEELLSARLLRTADLVIVLGATIDVARLPGPRYEEWDVVNDDLQARVRALSDQLTNPELTSPELTSSAGGRVAVWRASVGARLRRILASRRGKP